MALKDIFTTRYKLAIHIVQIILIVAAMGLSVPRIFMKNQPRTRANTIALGMGAKSLIFIAYQLLTEHARPFKRWASLKANLILNGLEPAFWGAVAFLIIQANISRCVGIGCTLSWVVVGIAIPLNLLAAYMAVVSYLEYRHAKQASRENELQQMSSTDSRDSRKQLYISKYGQTPAV